jgi:hypothetical protein
MIIFYFCTKLKIKPKSNKFPPPLFNYKKQHHNLKLTLQGLGYEVGVSKGSDTKPPRGYKNPLGGFVFIPSQEIIC